MVHLSELAAVLDFFGAAMPCRVESGAYVWQIVKRDPRTDEIAVLVENLSDVPADVKIVTGSGVRVVDSLRGEFKSVPSGLALGGLAPHEFAAVRFR